MSAGFDLSDGVSSETSMSADFSVSGETSMGADFSVSTAPNSRPRSAIGVGVATLVTIIVAVLLTTFSVLTLVTARADLRYSTKAIESTQNYYATDGQAEQWLAKLDGFVAEEHEVFLPLALGDAGYQVSTTTDGRVLITEVFSIDDKRELTVEVAIDNDGGLDVLTWQSGSKR